MMDHSEFQRGMTAYERQRLAERVEGLALALSHILHHVGRADVVLPPGVQTLTDTLCDAAAELVQACKPQPSPLQDRLAAADRIEKGA